MSPVNLKFRGFTTLSKSYRKETDRQTDGCNTLSFLRVYIHCGYRKHTIYFCA